MTVAAGAGAGGLAVVVAGVFGVTTGTGLGGVLGGLSSSAAGFVLAGTTGLAEIAGVISGVADVGAGVGDTTLDEGA